MDPLFEERFKKAEIEEMVRNLIVEKLDNVEYDGTDWNLNVHVSLPNYIGVPIRINSSRKKKLLG